MGQEQDRLQIKGRLKYYLYHNDDNAYSVVALDVEECSDDSALEGQDAIISVGTLPRLPEESVIRCEGYFTEHKKYGRQFRIERLLPPEEEDDTDVLGISETAEPSAREVKRYLESGTIPQIGPKTAEKLFEAWGAKALIRLSENPEKAASLTRRSKRQMQEAADFLNEQKNRTRLLLFLSGLGLSSALIQKIEQRWGFEAKSLIEENPFLLLDSSVGLSFKACDKLWLELGRKEISQSRAYAALYWLLRRALQEGHTCLRESDLLSQGRVLLLSKDTAVDDDDEEEASSSVCSVADIREQVNKTEEEALEHCLQSAKDRFPCISRLEQGREIRYRYLSEYYAKEEIVLSFLLNRKRERFSELLQPEALIILLQRVQTEERLRLNTEQLRAVQMAVKHSLGCITGRPGTGKTTMLRILCRILEEEKKNVLLAAPTGRAAKRLTEQTGLEAKTLHRLLEVQVTGDVGRGDIQFLRNKENKLEGDILIIDECSMIDLSLFAALVSAIPDNMNVILVGDPDQLPPVAAGDIFDEILDSEQFAVARLRTILRQKEGSLIVQNAHRVLRGEPLLVDQRKETDCMQIISPDDRHALPRVLRFLEEILPREYSYDPLLDAQIFTPMRKGILGVNSLNRAFQSLRQEQKPTPGIELADRAFHVGDKVMHIRNNYELEYLTPEGTKEKGIFNGERGLVTAINKMDDSLHVTFEDGKQAAYARKDLTDLQLAYAMTIHKSQGCEYPVVVVILPHQYTPLESRSLLYTAITRARQKLFIFTSSGVINRYLSVRAIHRPTCLLAYRLRENQ